MSQTELSRRTGIATSTISDWRKKQINPQADKLAAICKALDMSLVDLLCDEGKSGSSNFYGLFHR
ncbi:MAG: helix-turn-helix transcriptional regulator [Lachnospiraceae bacterium]